MQIIHSIQYFRLSFHIVHLLYVIMLIGDREYLISFLLFPSGMKHRFPIQINIVHTCKINTEKLSAKHECLPTSQFGI